MDSQATVGFRAEKRALVIENKDLAGHLPCSQPEMLSANAYVSIDNADAFIEEFTYG